MCNEKHHGPKGFAGCFIFGLQDIRKMKHMAKHFMHGFMGSHIPFNLEDLEDFYLITVPLAGRTKEDVKVSLINKHINIKADKPKIPLSYLFQEFLVFEVYLTCLPILLLL